MKRWIALGAVTAVVYGAGMAAAGYLYAVKTMTSEFDAALTEEIAAAKRHYAMLYKKDQFASPISSTEDALPIERDAAEAMHLYQGTTKVVENGFNYQQAGFVATEFDNAVPEDTGAAEVLTSVFNGESQKAAEEALERTWKMEMMQRGDDMPYILRHDEFGEDHNTQIELTWYAGDDTLADDQDNIIEDPDETVGLYNLKRFGEWSDDPNVVYVRNEARGADFSITRTKASYQVTVAGL